MLAIQKRQIYGKEFIKLVSGTLMKEIGLRQKRRQGFFSSIGDRYEGSWFNDMKHDYGELEFADGDKYKGWKNDKITERANMFVNGANAKETFNGN